MLFLHVKNVNAKTMIVLALVIKFAIKTAIAAATTAKNAYAKNATAKIVHAKNKVNLKNYLKNQKLNVIVKNNSILGSFGIFLKEPF